MSPKRSRAFEVNVINRPTAAFGALVLSVGLLITSGTCAEPPRHKDEQPLRQPKGREGSIPKTTTGAPASSGTFKVGDRSFSIVLEKAQLAGAAKPAFAETVVSLEIRDDAGKTHYREAFEPDIYGGAFRQSLRISAAVLEDHRGTPIGLVVLQSTTPSAPGHGTACQLFAPNAGLLKPLSKPLHYARVLGSSCDLRPGSAPNAFALDSDRGASNTAHLWILQLWTGYVAVRVPMMVDLASSTIRPQQSEGVFQIEPSERYTAAGETVVRLYANRHLSGSPAHVTVNEKTRVELLDVHASIAWEERPTRVHVRIKDSALRVRIDNQEGWVTGDQDLSALGLPARMR